MRSRAFNSRQHCHEFLMMTYICEQKVLLYEKMRLLLFWSESVGTVLEINFINSSCVRLSHKIDALSGTSMSLIVSPNTVSVNGITHTNYWK